MLGRESELFQSIKSIEYVCYRESEVTDTELKRLLRELPGVGVTLIELDALEARELEVQTVREPEGQTVCELEEQTVRGSEEQMVRRSDEQVVGKPDVQIVCESGVRKMCTGEKSAGENISVRSGQITPCPATTLLLAGSARTLALAKGTPMATVGYGSLVAVCGEEDAAFVGDVDNRAHGKELCGKADGLAGRCDGNGSEDVGEEESNAAELQPDILVEGFEEVDVQFLDRIMKRAQGLPWITVVTEHCYLREITLDDMDDLFELYAQPGITDYTEPLYKRPEEEQYTRDYIDKMYRFYGYGMWLVCDRADGKLIGRAGFSHQDLGDEIVLEMGYIIGVPYQRQGYATEVCKKLIQFAGENLSDFGTLNCFVELGNTASHGLMGKLHFQQMGTVEISGKTMVRYELELC